VRRHLTRIVVFCLWLVTLAAATQTARAQSSVLNVPSTDVVPRGSLYAEADYIAHPAPYEKGGFHFFGPSLIYGVRKNFEVGVNAYFTKSSGADAAELQPNAKWQFYADERRGIAAAAGGILFVPPGPRGGANTNAMLYATLSKQLKSRFGPRLTSGAYGFVGRIREGETRGGILLGYEQPVHRRLTLVSDWSSGTNSYGYASAGFGLTLTRKSLVYAGYSFGNTGRANNWLGVFYGHTF
jgi:hypothetical protein